MPALVLPNTIANATPADGAKVQENFVAVRDHVNTEKISRDGSVSFTNPVGGVAPTAAAHLVTKDYADALLADTGWQALTLQNGWVNVGSTWETAAVRKYGKTVFLRGLVQNGTVGATVFTLAAEFRPAQDFQFAAVAGNEFGRVAVRAGGATDIVTAPSTTFVSLHASWIVA